MTIFKGEPVVVSRRSDGRLEVAVHAVSGWEGFDKLLHYLEEIHEADLLGKVDGPDARRAWLVVGNVSFELEYDGSCGSSLVAPDIVSEDFVREVGNDLSCRLAGL